MTTIVIMTATIVIAAIATRSAITIPSTAITISGTTGSREGTGSIKQSIIARTMISGRQASGSRKLTGNGGTSTAKTDKRLSREGRRQHESTPLSLPMNVVGPCAWFCLLQKL